MNKQKDNPLIAQFIHTVFEDVRAAPQHIAYSILEQALERLLDYVENDQPFTFNFYKDTEQFEVVSELLGGDEETTTLSRIKELINTWDRHGWIYTAYLAHNDTQIHVLAMRNNSDNLRPSSSSEWLHIDKDKHYFVAAVKDEE